MASSVFAYGQERGLGLTFSVFGLSSQQMPLKLPLEGPAPLRAVRTCCLLEPLPALGAKSRSTPRPALPSNLGMSPAAFHNCRQPNILRYSHERY